MEQDQGQSLPPGVAATQYASVDMQPQPMPVQEGPFALGLAADAGRASNIAWTTIPPMHPLSGGVVQMFKVCAASCVPRQPRCRAIRESPEPGLWAVAQALPEWPLAWRISRRKALGWCLPALSDRRRSAERCRPTEGVCQALLTSFRRPVSFVLHQAIT
jgi:hypothetical protein